MLIKPLDYLAKIGLETDPEVAAKYNWAQHLSPDEVSFVRETNRKVMGSTQSALHNRTPYASLDRSRPPSSLSAEQTERFYNILARVSDQVSNDPVYLDSVLQIYLDEVAKHQGTPVLDVCAGTGLYTAFFAANLPDRQFLAMDLSAGMLGELEKKVRKLGIWNLSSIRGDFLRMERPGFSVPTIIAVGLHGAMDYYNFLEKSSRVVSPGGKIILMDEIDVDWRTYEGGKPKSLLAVEGDMRDCTELYTLKLQDPVNPVAWHIIRGHKGTSNCITIKTFQKP